MERAPRDSLSVEELARLHVERLDVQRGDVVLVVYPADWDHDQAKRAMESFEWLREETGAIAFGVPDSLTFKVVRASDS